MEKFYIPALDREKGQILKPYGILGTIIPNLILLI